jgi:hypothetical protein
LEHAADCMPQASYEIVQNQFWVVRCCACMSLVTRMSSAKREDRAATHTNICFVNSIDVSLKYAEGPLGRCTNVIASDWVR